MMGGTYFACIYRVVREWRIRNEVIAKGSPWHNTFENDGLP